MKTGSARTVAGPLLLHASKGCTRREHDAAVDLMLSGKLARVWALGSPENLPVIPPLAQLNRGGIVGVCEAIGCVSPDESISWVSEDAWKKTMTPDGNGIWRWHARGQYGLILANVRPLPFTPYSGALGLFDVPESIVGPLLIEVP